MGMNLESLEREQGAIVRFDGEFSFLSNFHPSPIHPWWWPETLPAFPTVEHAFAASKVDSGVVGAASWLALVERIRLCDTPGKAKRLGRSVPLRGDWETGVEQLRVRVMRELLCAKFARGSVLAQLLINTGDRMLVEGNTWGDVFWGVTEQGGANTLGKLLMERRMVLLRRC